MGRAPPASTVFDGMPRRESATAALKIYVRTYIARFVIQVNNVMLLTPAGAISALSSELCIADGRTASGSGPQSRFTPKSLNRLDGTEAALDSPAIVQQKWCKSHLPAWCVVL
ncbi:hypothetical protein EJB05_29428 [Eragrostis curvula]|uniref:Uncharacterized protein n=1 Tax=Eragrostis curvula TaxID=38414 RepID=A0A5J9USM5_9POAL|nr:hypothetical protein EJB05_29428 [Eragrostis curvula]